MAKIISVADDVYSALTNRKGKESYSVIIRQLLHSRSNKEKILSFYGRGGIDTKAVVELKEGWKRWSEKYV